MKKTTLNDIAKETGVSPSMVSRVLNGKNCRISESKRENILNIARERNYTPNQIARSLVNQKSNTFGLILPSIRSRLFTNLTEQLEQECALNNFGLFIANSANTCDGDTRAIELLDARGVDGIFIVPSYDSFDNPKIIECLEASSVPVVLALRFLKDIAWDGVTFDNEYGGYVAARYLIQQGHTKIGCVANMSESNTGRLRFNGYMRALLEADIEINPSYIFQSPYTMKGGYEAGRSLLKTDISAVVCGSDYIALGLRKAYLEAGKQVPDDLLMVTFDASESDFLFDPPPPSIMQDISTLGKELFSIMERRLNGEKGNPIATVLKPTFIEDGISF